MKFDLKERRVRHLLTAALSTACAALLAVLFIPLSIQISAAGKKLEGFLGKIQEARAVTVTQAQLEHPLPFPKRNEIAFVMDEITELGTRHGVDFRSIRPEAMEETPSGYALYPIRMTLISSYEKLGRFVGSLRGLKTACIRVDIFEIERDMNILPAVRSTLVVKAACEIPRESG